MRLVTAATVLAVALTATGARAQDHDPAAAESLFRGAKASEQRGDYKKACAQFAESQRLDPAAGTLLNEADCEEHIGAVASAWGHYTEARDQLSKADDRLPFALQRIAALEKRVPHLVVRLPTGAPSGTRVARGNVEIGAAALGVPLAVDPGSIAITVTVPGQPPITTNVTVAEGETKEVTLDLVGGPSTPAQPQTAPTPGQPADQSTAPSSSSDSKRTLGFVVGGVGVAGLVVGAVTGIMAMGDASTFKNDCGSNGACQHQSGVDAASAGKTASTLSTIGFIGGAAITGVGVYLVLSSGPSAPATRVGATPLPGGGGLSFGGSF